VDPAPPSPAAERIELPRDVSVWGSFMWGYADVGADIYAALGLVIAYTMGAAPLVAAGGMMGRTIESLLREAGIEVIIDFAPES
jgi:hypothetical protein